MNDELISCVPHLDAVTGVGQVCQDVQAESNNDICFEAVGDLGYGPNDVLADPPKASETLLPVAECGLRMLTVGARVREGKAGDANLFKRLKV